MSVNDTSRNGSMPTSVEESTEPVSSQEPVRSRESTVLNGRQEPATTFATRADVKGVEGTARASSFFSAADWPLRFCSLCSRPWSEDLRRSQRQ